MISLEKYGDGKRYRCFVGCICNLYDNKYGYCARKMEKEMFSVAGKIIVIVCVAF